MKPIEISDRGHVVVPLLANLLRDEGAEALQAVINDAVQEAGIFVGRVLVSIDLEGINAASEDEAPRERKQHLEHTTTRTRSRSRYRVVLNKDESVDSFLISPSERWS